jgi:hypothetical protein
MKTRSLMKLSPVLLTALTALTGCSDATATAIAESEIVELVIESGETRPLDVDLDEDIDVTLTVECSLPSHPDLDGGLVSVDAPTLDAPEVFDGAVRSGYWQWAGTMGAGDNRLSVFNAGNDSTLCNIDLRKQSGSDECNSWTVHRSRIRGAAHLPVGDLENGEWEALPASGNHWGAWPMWAQVYEAPVLRGFLLHGLEHGGAVLSYRCESSDESEECSEAAAQLVELANESGQHRLFVTPDPSQPTMFAVRTWRWAYASDCLNRESALGFVNDHIRHGREDIDGDPPIAFDPTTEDVPCENLMAAPDSC